MFFTARFLLGDFFVRFLSMEKARKRKFPEKLKSYEEIILNYALVVTCARLPFVLFRKKFCRE